MGLTTANQLRAARALIAWEQTRLAEAAGISIGTVRRMEASDGPLRGNAGTVRRVQATLEAAGVEFTDGNAPGVRMRVGGAQE